MWFIKRCDTTQHYLTSGLFQGECFKDLNPVNKKREKTYSMKEFATTLRWQQKKIQIQDTEF